MQTENVTLNNAELISHRGRKKLAASIDKKQRLKGPPSMSKGIICVYGNPKCKQHKATILFYEGVEDKVFYVKRKKPREAVHLVFPPFCSYKLILLALHRSIPTGRL